MSFIRTFFGRAAFQALAAAGAVGILVAGCGQAEKDRRVEVAIVSAPPGADLAIDHRPLNAKTPIKLKLSKGARLLEVSKDGYKTAYQKILCVDPVSRVEVKLAPLTSSVLIETVPPGAEVTMEGNPIGETPLVSRELKIGDYVAILKKPGFSAKEVRWTIKDARPLKIKTALQSNMGKLFVTSVPVGAEVTIDSAPFGKTPLRAPVELSAGEYKVSLRLDGHRSFESKVIIEREKEARVNGELPALPGAIAITVSPATASVTLRCPDGKVHQLGNGPATVGDLVAGNYKLQVTCPPDYDREERDITVSPGKTETVAIALTGNTGGVDIVADPPGVTIYVDGKKFGQSLASVADARTAKVFPIRGLSAGRHELTIAHKNAEPSKKTVRFQVEKNKITRVNPVSLWVRDTYLKLTNGEVIRGRMLRENAKEVYIQREPSISQGFPRKQILEVRPLKDVE